MRGNYEDFIDQSKLPQEANYKKRTKEEIYEMNSESRNYM